MRFEERARRGGELDGRVALALQALRELGDRGIANVDQGRNTVGGSTAIGTCCSRNAFVLRSMASPTVVAITSGSSIEVADVLSDVRSDVTGARE
jgi:hypothetical protein